MGWSGCRTAGPEEFEPVTDELDPGEPPGGEKALGASTSGRRFPGARGTPRSARSAGGRVAPSIDGALVAKRHGRAHQDIR